MIGLSLVFNRVRTLRGLVGQSRHRGEEGIIRLFRMKLRTILMLPTQILLVVNRIRIFP